MSWFRLDDGWATHPKTVAAGKDGRMLFVTAGTQCAANDTDGFVAAPMVKFYASIAEVPVAKTARLLVEAGCWHDSKTIRDCAECFAKVGELAAGAYFFHQWWEHQLSRDTKTDPIARRHEVRRKQLYRLPELTRSIRERDRDQCRYCGVRTVWVGGGRGGDRKSKTAGTFDHVDPFGDNSLANVVVACHPCNSRKKDRTPEEAGMELRPAPVPYQQPINRGSTSDQSHIDPKVEVGRDSGHGSGRIDSGIDGRPARSKPGIDRAVDLSIDPHLAAAQ